MGKFRFSNHLNGQRTARPLLAMTLAASLAALGCTTNYNPGNGTPTRSGPEVRTAPTSGVTSGSETATPVYPPSMTSSSNPSYDQTANPPMTSSYTQAQALPAVRARGVIRRSPDEAAAIMAGRQQLQGRYLGVSNPGASARGYQSDGIQTFVPPALRTNPQLTVNATISSDPFPAVTSGADTSATFDSSGNVSTGTTAAATFPGADVSPTAATPTTLTPGTFAGAGTLPTLASSGVPSVTAASVGAARRGGVTTGATTTNGAAANGAAVTNGTTAASTSGARAALGSRSAGLASPVRILRGSNGNVTVTNNGTAAGTTGTTGATTSGRSQ